MKKEKTYHVPIPPAKRMVAEPEVVYPAYTKKAAAKEVFVKDFTYDEFKPIVEKSPFTLGDWSDLLYLSERTLHRYAKEDSAFNGLQIERILQLEKLIDFGNDFFGKEGFKNWLSYKPFSLGGTTVKGMLTTHDGIQEVIDLIGRMQHGITA